MIQVNKKIIVKCMQTALVMTLFGMVLQVAKGQLILKLPPPELGFIMGVVVSYILVGFLYAFAFSIFKNALPGKTPTGKGVYYALLCSLIVMIPGILGVTAYDFEGQYDLFTPYKIEQYLTCLIDVLNLGIGGLALGKLFNKDIIFRESVSKPKIRLVISSVMGAAVLPLLMLGTHLLAEEFIPIGLDIPNQAEQWYYISFSVPLVLTGGFLPLFYYYAKDALTGKWPLKSLKFFFVFYLCYWFMNIGFLINFGFTPQYVLFLLAISIPTLLLIIMLNGIIIERNSKEMLFIAEEKTQ